MKKNITELCIIIYCIVIHKTCLSQEIKTGCEITPLDGYITTYCYFLNDEIKYTFHWNIGDIENNTCYTKMEQSQWLISNDTHYKTYFNTIDVLEIMKCVIIDGESNFYIDLEIYSDDIKESKYIYRVYTSMNKNEIQYTYSTDDNIILIDYYEYITHVDDVKKDVIIFKNGKYNNELDLLKIQQDGGNISMVVEKYDDLIWTGVSRNIKPNLGRYYSFIQPIKVVLQNKIYKSKLKEKKMNIIVRATPISTHVVKILGLNGFPYIQQIKNNNDLWKAGDTVHIDMTPDKLFYLHQRFDTNLQSKDKTNEMNIATLKIYKAYIRDNTPYKFDRSKFREWIFVHENIANEVDFKNHVEIINDISNFSLSLKLPQLSRKENLYTLYIEFHYELGDVQNSSQYNVIQEKKLTTFVFLMKGCDLDEIYYHNIMKCIKVQLNNTYYIIIIILIFFIAGILIRILNKNEFKRYLYVK
ncbi:hypothetical protein EON71_00050 [bacterium]|nr:MAG: hypothetical protein EON71_00050 [bacterium]